MSFKSFSRIAEQVNSTTTTTPTETPKEVPQATPGSTPPHPNKDKEQPSTDKPK